MNGGLHSQLNFEKEWLLLSKMTTFFSYCYNFILANIWLFPLTLLWLHSQLKLFFFSFMVALILCQRFLISVKTYWVWFCLLSFNMYFDIGLKYKLFLKIPMNLKLFVILSMIASFNRWHKHFFVALEWGQDYNKYSSTKSLWTFIIS